MKTWRECETLLVERDGGAVRVTFNRPARLNAWIPKLGEELLETLDACRDRAVRAVLLRGSGRGFCAGADLSDPSVSTPNLLRDFYNPVILAIRALEKPVVAAVHGGAAGIGCSCAVACDVVLMSQSAYFLLAFAKVGLVLDGGASLIVPRRVGGGRALRMGLLAERVPASEARDWGLADRVVPDDAFAAESDALLRELAEGPTAGYAGIKRQLNETVFHGLAEQLELEAQLQEQAAASADFAEGARAFLERRTPVFTGR